MSVETREREDGNLGRRSLVRAGVWAIPVVTVAAAAPALAVSGTPTLSMPPGTTAWQPGQLPPGHVHPDAPELECRCDDRPAGPRNGEPGG